MKKVLLNFWRSPQITTTADRITWSIIIFARLSVILAGIWAVFQPDRIVLGMTVLTLVASYIPTFVERYYKLKLPLEYHLVIVAFLYMSLFLGEVGGAYARYWWWDSVLHASSGIVLGYIGFLVLYVLQAKQKISLSPFFIALFSFCVAVTCGVFWEFFEFTVDQLRLGPMQHGNSDTMKDLIVDSIGALIIAVSGYRYFKHQQTSFIERTIRKFMSLNPHLSSK